MLEAAVEQTANGGVCSPVGLNMINTARIPNEWLRPATGRSGPRFDVAELQLPLSGLREMAHHQAGGGADQGFGRSPGFGDPVLPLDGGLVPDRQAPLESVAGLAARRHQQLLS